MRCPCCLMKARQLMAQTAQRKTAVHYAEDRACFHHTQHTPPFPFPLTRNQPANWPKQSKAKKGELCFFLRFAACFCLELGLEPCSMFLNTVKPHNNLNHHFPHTCFFSPLVLFLALVLVVLGSPSCSHTLCLLISVFDSTR